MNKPAWSEAEIERSCGKLSSRKGRQLAERGLVAIRSGSAGSGSVQAEVMGRPPAQVVLRWRKGSLPEASCSFCLDIGSYGQSCKHVAAVLYALRSGEKAAPAEKTPAADDGASRLGRSETDRALDSLKQAFQRQPRPGSGLSRPALFDARLPLPLRFDFEPRARKGEALLCVGLSVRLSESWRPIYRLRSFLSRIMEGRRATITPAEAYDPERHRFEASSAALLRALARIASTETLFRASGSGAPGEREDRLDLPPGDWEEIVRLAEACPEARLHGGDRPAPFRLDRSESTGLRFELETAPHGGGVLTASGLDALLALPAYGAALGHGRLFALGHEGCARLAALQELFRPLPDGRLALTRPQLEQLARHVLPGLGRMAEVSVSPRMAQRIERPPLKARLYLDRVKDRLVADLEFRYGDVVLQPLQEGEEPARGRILVRDREKEADILELLKEGRMTMAEQGCFLAGEEEEFAFLYEILPRLEPLVQVYATTAVKTRLHPDPPPQIRAQPDERTDWLEFRFEMNGIPESEIRAVLQSLEEKRPYHRLRSGALLPLRSEAYRQMIRYINETGFAYAERTAYGYRAPAAAGISLLEELSGSPLVETSAEAGRLLQELRQPDRSGDPLPQGLQGELRDYQKSGYRWLKALARYRFGGILADEMGLGKTVQAIAFMLSIREEIRRTGRPSLVVCPSSLVYNWAAELERFAPELRLAVADGAKKERLRKLAGAGAGEADVVIASYPLLRLDAASYEAQPFTALLLDEAQTIKNESTQTARAVSALTAEYRFALTGTPVENHAADLWSIFHAVFPRLLGSKRQFEEMPREELAARTRPFLLRRLKRDVIRELPDKIETLHSAELLPEQKKLYAAYLVQLQQETLRHIDKDELEQNRIRILAGITRLRQICDHPALFVEGYEGGSAKLEQLASLVRDALEAGRRPLIFSQFTSMLALIRRRLEQEGMDVFQLDGSTPSRERVELCRRFNEGERDVFLLSLKAGGTGLNLTGADTVILYDLWWNPAVEQQAMDRAHRIGQQRVVQVIRLAARGTIEQKMHELQSRKLRMMEELVRPADAEADSLSDRELLELISVVPRAGGRV
ncbi:DEAD/DEAH box helicase family protein [Paenibacillus albicereus]|uniref:DEAD/DEAH box helicase family protein n=1 Tax=Paenibacillus albicereus TaxID=2726185 RepID=A0A6H2GWB2_9BACL|nr:DEAD/DEAH box helicase [Paenibacillus albicereus]QJC51714.1 DEAD/DEAH box helicase family protein [Paenibacillus albicereus]